MERILEPDFGLMIWTLATFLLLVFVLGRFAWKPLLAAIEEREERIRKESEAAGEARQGAEKIRSDLEEQWRSIEKRTEELLARAEKEGAKAREGILQAARREAEELAEKTRRQLEEEKTRLVAELRGQVADISVSAAEKILKKEIERESQEKFLREAMDEIARLAQGRSAP